MPLYCMDSFFIVPLTSNFAFTTLRISEYTLNILRTGDITLDITQVDEISLVIRNGKILLYFWELKISSRS